MSLYFLNLPISLLFVVPFLLNDKRNNVSNYLILILLIGILLPLSTLYTFGLVPLDWFLINLSSFLFITLMNNFLSTIKFKTPSFENSSLFELVFYSFYIISTIMFFIKYGFNIDFDLLAITSDLVYSQRANFKSMGSAGYLIMTFFTLGTPLLFAYSIIYRNFFLTSISLLLGMMIYSTSSEKSLLFTFALYFGIIIIEKISNHSQQISYIKGYIFMTIVASLLFFVNPLLSGLFINRLIFVPQLVSLSYYNYFQKYDYSYFLDTSVFSSIFGKSYHTDLPREISRIFFEIGSSANTGLISDGYAKLGIMGVAIVLVVFLVVLKIVDSFSYGKNLFFVKLVMTYSVFTLINSSIFTAFLTSGLLFSLLLIFILPRNYYGYKIQYEK
jgi:hypothetical protein